MKISRYLRLAMVSVVLVGAAGAARASVCPSAPPHCDLGNQSTPGITIGNQAPYDVPPNYALVGPGDGLTFKGDFGPDAGSFNTTWYFTTNQGSLFLDSASFIEQGINGFSAQLFNAGNSAIGPFGGFTPGTVYNLIPLTAAATYHFVVSGTATGGAPHYSFNGRVVPLPAAAWLLLSGVAGLGALARRRKVAVES